MFTLYKNRIVCSILGLLLCLMGKNGFGQKEANNWFLGNHAGIDFNSGYPVIRNDGSMLAQMGSTAMSDTAGNLLFYSNGVRVWSRDHEIMPNAWYLSGCDFNKQSCITMLKPGSDHLYYLFTVNGTTCSPSGLNAYGAFYSIIDMTLNNGMGDVVTSKKDVPIPNTDSATNFVAAIRHANKKDFWIFFRNFYSQNYFSAYLLDENGLHNQPVKSNCITNYPTGASNVALKISTDGKYMATEGVYGNNTQRGELYSLDAATGIINPVIIYPIQGQVYGYEFSANSEYLYNTTMLFGDTVTVFQYDMKYRANPTLFTASKKIVYQYTGIMHLNAMQLAPNGKIYICQQGSGPIAKYLAAINYPSEPGLACSFQKDALYLESGNCLNGLPNFVPSYFSKFDWLNTCRGDTTKFTSHFLPPPDSVRWNFDDVGSGTNNTSSLLNPVHFFTGSGTFNVYVVGYYTNGHNDTATREVKITPYPAINLGNDYTVCKGDTVTLDAGFGILEYLWNTGATTRTITTSDTGMYFVRVENQNGCAISDSVRISNFPDPVLDQTNLNIAPTTCKGITGAITGLKVNGNPPYSYQWTEKISGKQISDSIDIYHLGVGLYELSVTDAAGCSKVLTIYTIQDVGYLLIDTALASPALCGNSNGSITVKAVSGLGNMLQYFVKTGNDTLSQWSNGQFNGLAGGTYYVWVSDSSGCSSVYPVPLVIDELTAPAIVSATSTPETGTASDGTITVNALGTGLTYSLNGATPQNIGHFTGLSAGNYSIKVTNPAGCDTIFTVTVAHESGIVLSAIAGSGFACLGKEAKAPLLVSNFKNVQSFETMLNYDKLFVTCIGYANPLPQLADSLEVTLFPASGKIQTRWKGTTPLTLPDSSEMVQLVFSSQLPGNALLLWDISPAVSNFYGPGGDTLNVNYTLGTILISNPPKILPEPEQLVCEGELLWVSRTVINGTGPLSYQWQTPIGPVNQEIIIKTATLADNGLYELIVTDTVQCADTSAKMVTVSPTPVSQFPTATDTLYFDERRELKAGEPTNQYLWNTGDTTNQILVTAEGLYKVTITTPEGCQSTDSVMMLKSIVPLIMPNAFSPDGDGWNDVFCPIALSDKISSYSMYVYNLWGQQLFFGQDISNGWDGTTNGKPAPMGVYVYVVRYAGPSGEVKEKRGMVTLVR